MSEAAGQWAGREVEVVYDPRQHQVALFRNEPAAHICAELGEAGFRRYAADGKQEMWVRDKTAQAEALLDRSAALAARQRATTIGAPGL